jgi:hypothetical protein
LEKLLEKLIKKALEGAENSGTCKEGIDKVVTLALARSVCALNSIALVLLLNCGCGSNDRYVDSMPLEIHHDSTSDKTDRDVLLNHYAASIRAHEASAAFAARRGDWADYQREQDRIYELRALVERLLNRPEVR